MRTGARQRGCERRDGLSLVEVTMAFALLALCVLSVTMTVVHGVQHNRHSFDTHRGLGAVRDLLAEIQDTANHPQNLTLQQGIGAIYQKYHGNTYPVPGLPDAKLLVRCYPDEPTVPGELGGAQDLNFDGDAQDYLGGVSNGTDLKLVPVEIEMQYREGDAEWSFTVHRLVTRTTDT